MSTLRLKRASVKRSIAPVTRINRPDYFGSSSPDIVFVVDPMVGKSEDDEAPKVKSPVTGRQLDFLTEYCKKHDIPIAKSGILWACPPVTAEQWDSDKKTTDHRKAHRDDFVNVIQKLKPKLIVAMGKTGASQVLNRSAKITQLRGTPLDSEEFGCVVFPTLGLSHVIRIPDVEPTFNADMGTLSKVIHSGYSLEYQTKVETNYQWVEDIGFLLANPPEYLSVDIEGIGLRWYDPKSTILTVQLCAEEGVSYCLPINYNHLYHGERNPERMYTKPASKVVRDRLVAQLKLLLENPKVKCFGQNFKFDFMMLRAKLGIIVANYEDDTILLSHATDENLKQRSLDELTRLHIPDLSGYADDFNRDPVHMKKSRMDLVPPDKMLNYGCPDTDAAWRLRKIFLDKLGKDPKALNCYRRVVMPAMRAFCDVEQYGFTINKEALRRFEKELRIHQAKEYKKIFAMVPKSIRDAYILKDKKWNASITRPAFLLQMLFLHKDGLRLKAKVFTKSTKNLKDHKARVPSVSTKEHLPYFEEEPFVAEIMQFIKNEKLLGTYVGTEGDEDGGSVKGFYKYIFDNKIRPSYLLHGTTTGRSASRDPNGQNFPKHGDLAKRYREIFVAPPGWCLLEVDFSQIELRIAAIAANEPTMLRLYREGADIHAMTAAAVMGLTLEQFKELDPDTRAQKRFEAKAVNFGFLYGMGWRKFITYAKTTYGVEFNDEEAQEIRKTFFKLYRNLSVWHGKVREFVKEHGYVRAFDGRVRHLPSVKSPDEAIASAAERQAINSPVQAFGSDLGLMALQIIAKTISRDLVIPIGFIHDAIVCMVPENRAKDGAAAVKNAMQTIPLKKWFGFQPPIPIVAEASVGKNLSKMVEIEDGWYEDNVIQTYHELQIKEWEGKCAKAKKQGKELPPRPAKTSGLRLIRKPKPVPSSNKVTLRLKSPRSEQAKQWPLKSNPAPINSAPRLTRSLKLRRKPDSPPWTS